MPRHVGIYGTNPNGVENRIYALYCPIGSEDEYMARAKEDGWTHLKADTQPQPILFDDPTPRSSASSASQKSPTTRQRSSRTSENASANSATRS